jgi:hypothetical protein
MKYRRYRENEQKQKTAALGGLGKQKENGRQDFGSSEYGSDPVRKTHPGEMVR